MDSDANLWTTAMWSGVSLFSDPAGASPPGMGLVFEDEECGKTIFQRWRTLGPQVGETVRVAIIERSIPRHAEGYFVHIGPRYPPTSGSGPAMSASHVVRVRASHDSQTLSTFKSDYAKHGCYQLFPVTIHPLTHVRTARRSAWRADPLARVLTFVELAIMMPTVVFRDIADIADPNDPDRIVLGRRRMLRR